MENIIRKVEFKTKSNNNNKQKSQVIIKYGHKEQLHKHLIDKLYKYQS